MNDNDLTDPNVPDVVEENTPSKLPLKTRLKDWKARHSLPRRAINEVSYGALYGASAFIASAAVAAGLAAIANRIPDDESEEEADEE